MFQKSNKKQQKNQFISTIMNFVLFFKQAKMTIMNFVPKMQQKINLLHFCNFFVLFFKHSGPWNPQPTKF